VDRKVVAGMKLFRVTCQGMNIPQFVGVTYGIAYVVAEDAAKAYQRVRDALDESNIGFKQEREMQKVELIAEETEYPACGFRLYT